MTDEAFELTFLAPVPRGNDVHVVAMRRDPDSEDLVWLVLDRTAGIVYCGEQLWGPLGASAAAIATDPVAALTRWSWTVARSVSGQVVAALVVSSDIGDSNFSKTKLLVRHASPR
jgi:hypothetical protein